jgi:hypothetical protein
MKNFFILCFAIILSGSSSAQGLFNTLTEKYSSCEGFSATNLTRDMFDLYLKKKQVDMNSPVYETLKKLDNILVVSLAAMPIAPEPLKPGDSGTEMQKIILDHYRKQSFTLFKTENKNGEDLKVFLRKEGEKISTLALISMTPARTSMVELNGEIDLASISELNKALSLKGLENLYKINGQSDYTTFWYEKYGIDHDFPREQQHYLQEMNENLKLLNEEKMEEWKQKNKQLFEKQKEMAEKYGRQPIFLSAPGDTNIVYIIDGKKVEASEIKKIHPDRIESIVVTKPDQDHPAKKGEIRIKTRK